MNKLLDKLWYTLMYYIAHKYKFIAINIFIFFLHFKFIFYFINSIQYIQVPTSSIIIASNKLLHNKLLHTIFVIIAKEFFYSF